MEVKINKVMQDAAKAIENTDKATAKIVPVVKIQADSMVDKSLFVSTDKALPVDTLVRLADKDHVYGVAKLAEPKPMTITEFRRRKDEHGLTDVVRKSLWPKARKYQGYTISSLEMYPEPVELVKDQTTPLTRLLQKNYTDEQKEKYFTQVEKVIGTCAEITVASYVCPECGELCEEGYACDSCGADAVFPHEEPSMQHKAEEDSADLEDTASPAPAETTEVSADIPVEDTEENAIEVSDEDNTYLAHYVAAVGDEKAAKGVVQLHFVGKTLHGDFRFESNKQALGYTLKLQRAGINAEVEDLDEAVAIAALFDPAGSRVNKKIKSPSRMITGLKEPHDAAWLKVKAEEFEPGEIGASKFKKGYMVEVARPKVSLGSRINTFQEYFVEKDENFQGIFAVRKVQGAWVSTITQSLMPAVLGKAAVDKGFIPPKGWSFLPPKLKSAVPKQFKYWLAEEEEERKEIRDALVEEKFFTKDNIKLVDGEFRRVEVKFFVEETEDEKGEANIEATTSLFKQQYTEASIEAVKKEYFNTVNMNIDELSKWDKEPTSETCTLDDSLIIKTAHLILKDKWGEEETTLAKCLINKIESNSNRPFVLKNMGVDVGDICTPLHHGPPSDLESIAKKDVCQDEKIKLAKSASVNWTLDSKKQDEEERYVLGVVLEPNTVDSQGDVYTEDTVRDACHFFMEYAQTLGLMHERAMSRQELLILECYIAPVDFEINDQQVKQGTWLLAARILNDDLWAAVKDGTFSGWSIEGLSQATILQ